MSLKALARAVLARNAVCNSPCNAATALAPPGATAIETAPVPCVVPYRDDETAERLVRVAERPPAGANADTWRAWLARAVDFETTWGSQARALGWTDGELYSLHPLAPMTRLDARGAAYFTHGSVVAVTADAVVLRVPPIGRIQRAYKPTLAAPPAWVNFATTTRAHASEDERERRA